MTVEEVAELIKANVELGASNVELRIERDAILRWSIKHAGYIGTCSSTRHDGNKWWARGDEGDVYGPTAEAVIRKAAGLETGDVTP